GEALVGGEHEGVVVAAGLGHRPGGGHGVGDEAGLGGGGLGGGTAPGHGGGLGGLGLGLVLVDHALGDVAGVGHHAGHVLDDPAHPAVDVRGAHGQVLDDLVLGPHHHLAVARALDLLLHEQVLTGERKDAAGARHRAAAPAHLGIAAAPLVEGGLAGGGIGEDADQGPFAAEAAVGQVERDRLVVLAEVAVDLRAAVVGGIVDHAQARSPVVADGDGGAARVVLDL